MAKVKDLIDYLNTLGPETEVWVYVERGSIYDPAVDHVELDLSNPSHIELLGGVLYIGG